MHVRFAWQAHEHEILHTVVREEYIQCVCLAGHLEEMHGLSQGILTLLHIVWSIVIILIRIHPRTPGLHGRGLGVKGLRGCLLG